MPRVGVYRYRYITTTDPYAKMQRQARIDFPKLRAYRLLIQRMLIAVRPTSYVNHHITLRTTALQAKRATNE